VVAEKVEGINRIANFGDALGSELDKKAVRRIREKWTMSNVGLVSSRTERSVSLGRRRRYERFEDVRIADCKRARKRSRHEGTREDAGLREKLS